MRKVEIVVDSKCPNQKQVEERVKEAFALINRKPKYSVWVSDEEASPDYAKQFGSPTVLVNGKDVAGELPGNKDCCRIYDNGGKIDGAPSAEIIATAIERYGAKRGRLLGLSALPGSLLALIPAVSCPACWPAYTSLLGLLGIPFFAFNVVWLYPLMAVFFGIALLIMAYNAKRRRGYGPFVLSIVACGLLVVGKFWVDLAALIYFGSALFISGAIWNAWPKSPKNACCSPQCDVSSKNKKTGGEKNE